MLEYPELLIPFLKAPICSVNASKPGPSDSKANSVPSLGSQAAGRRAEAVFFKLTDSSHRKRFKIKGGSKKEFGHT